jgi:hypothetical protein
LTADCVYRMISKYCETAGVLWIQETTEYLKFEFITMNCDKQRFSNDFVEPIKIMFYWRFNSKNNTFYLDQLGQRNIFTVEITI